MENKICNTCLREYPATTEHFYKRGKYLHNECKSCFREKRKGYRPKPEAVHEGEILAIKRLMADGIFATSGKSSQWGKFIDVVAWGCIKIEVKHATIDNRGRWQWTFASTINETTQPPDFILLIGQYKDGNLDYHLFPANHPVFFKNGKRKTGIMYQVESTQRNKRQHYVTLTPQIMRDYQDAFHQIETARLDKIRQMKTEHQAVVPKAA